MSRVLRVDDRWKGEHGIGRFATEVVRRITVPNSSLGGGESPTSPADVVNPRRLRLGKDDVVYSPGFNAGLTRARQFLNIHDLIHLQIESERSAAKTLYYNTVVRRAVRRAGLVMTDSDASASAIRSWVRDPSVEIVVVGCGRSAEFTPDGEKATFTRPTFIYVGNLKPHKNVDIVLDALALRPDYDLILVTGDATDAAARIAARGLTARVQVRSGIGDAELATLYRGVTGALQPSILEGFGLPALEAMSSGTRVAHWVGCESVAEICDGQGVAVAAADDAAQWAAALDQLLTRSDEALRLDDSWHDKYTWDAVGAKVDAVLRRVTASPTPASIPNRAASSASLD